MRLLACIIVLLAAKAAFCSSPDRCSLTSTVTDAKLTLSIPGGRTSFREGEIIPLELSFTSAANKHYRAVVRNYDRSGRLELDTYCLEPKARDPLADYLSTTLSIGGGLGGEQQLSETPFIATVELNEWRQPGPGHYRLYVVSPRVSGEPSSLNSLRAGAGAVSLRSNTIEFDVIEADAKSRAQQLQEATASYENATGGEQQEAARRLRFLSTKESTDTLARLFWSLKSQPGGWDLMAGLFGSPYRAEAIAAMRREINNPDHPITQDFLQVFTRLQLLQIAGEIPAPQTDDPVGLRRWNESLQKIGARQPEVTKDALTVTVAALRQKAGRARALTLEALATDSSDLLEKETASEVRRQLIAAWADLPDETRQSLIRNHLASFEGQEELHPLVQQAVHRIGTSDARPWDYSVVEVFGDKSVMGSLEVKFKMDNDHIPKGSCAPNVVPMLRYFLRIDAKVGERQVQANLDARKVTGCYPTLLEDLGKSLPAVEQLAISNLDDADVEVSTSAARALGRSGTAKAETALWARLTRFHQQWPTGVGELPLTDDHTIARVKALDNLENALVNSIATGTNWICGPDKLRRLRALASQQQRMNLSAWIDEWEGGDGPWILNPQWGPDDQLSFTVLQYLNLDETQIRVKLSQMPRGSKLYFQTYTAQQTGAPVSMEKQQAVLQGLRKYAAPIGVIIEERPR